MNPLQGGTQDTLYFKTPPNLRLHLRISSVYSLASYIHYIPSSHITYSILSRLTYFGLCTQKPISALSCQLLYINKKYKSKRKPTYTLHHKISNTNYLITTRIHTPIMAPTYLQLHTLNMKIYHNPTYLFSRFFSNASPE